MMMEESREPVCFYAFFFSISFSFLRISKVPLKDVFLLNNNFGVDIINSDYSSKRIINSDYYLLNFLFFLKDWLYFHTIFN
jgi:hypothetical protein